MSVRKGRTARERRQEIARAHAVRLENERADTQRQNDRSLLNARIAVLDATKRILDDAGHEYNVPEYELQRQHACGKPATCTLAAQTCSALNQNMPPHLILGQQS